MDTMHSTVITTMTVFLLKVVIITLFLLPGRIFEKGRLLKIKSFLAQEENAVWNEFNQAVSALVNEIIDEVRMMLPGNCNRLIQYC